MYFSIFFSEIYKEKLQNLFMTEEIFTIFVNTWSLIF